MIESYKVTELIVTNEFGVKDCPNCTENIRCAGCQRRVDEALKRTEARMKAHADAMAAGLLFGDVVKPGEPPKRVSMLPDKDAT